MTAVLKKGKNNEVHSIEIRKKNLRLDLRIERYL